MPHAFRIPWGRVGDTSEYSKTPHHPRQCHIDHTDSITAVRTTKLHPIDTRQNAARPHPPRRISHVSSTIPPTSHTTKAISPNVTNHSTTPPATAASPVAFSVLIILMVLTIIGAITNSTGAHASPAPQSSLFFPASMDAKPRTSSPQKATPNPRAGVPFSGVPTARASSHAAHPPLKWRAVFSAPYGSSSLTNV